MRWLNQEQQRPLEDEWGGGMRLLVLQSVPVPLQGQEPIVQHRDSKGYRTPTRQAPINTMKGYLQSVLHTFSFGSFISFFLLHTFLFPETHRSFRSYVLQGLSEGACSHTLIRLIFEEMPNSTYAKAISREKFKDLSQGIDGQHLECWSLE
jgi:hypothetical protein